MKQKIHSIKTCEFDLCLAFKSQINETENLYKFQLKLKSRKRNPKICFEQEYFGFIIGLKSITVINL